jgi:hypothetical protein
LFELVQQIFREHPPDGRASMFSSDLFTFWWETSWSIFYHVIRCFLFIDNPQILTLLRLIFRFFPVRIYR